MATLTAFAPGLAVGSVWTSPEVGTTPVLQVIASAVDTRYGEDAENSTHTLVQPYTLTGWPSDLVALTTLSYDIRYFWGTTPDGDVTWDTLGVRIMSGATVIAGSSAGGGYMTVASSITTTTPTNKGSTTFTYVNTGASKAELDAAQVEIQIDTTRTKGGDTAGRRVSAFEVSGTYEQPEAKTDFPSRHNSSTAKTITAALQQDQWGKYLVPQVPWVNPVQRGKMIHSATGLTYGRWSPLPHLLSTVASFPTTLKLWTKLGLNPVDEETTASTTALNFSAWSRDARFVATGANSPNYMTIFERSGVSLTALSAPATAPAAVAKDGAWSPDGRFLAVAHATTPFVTIYERSGTTGTTFTKLTNPGSLPAGTGNGCAWSPDGRFLAIAHATTPFVTIYERSGTTFTKLTNPSTLPADTSQGLDFSPDGKFLAVCNDTTSPRITLYRRDDTTFTKLTDPSALPSGIVYDCAFSPDGRWLAVGMGTSPYLRMYRVEESGLVYNGLTSGLGGATRSVAWSPDGRFLLLDNEIFETSGLNPREGYLWMSDPGER